MSLLRHVTASIQTMMDAVMPTRHAGLVLQAHTTQCGSSSTALATQLHERVCQALKPKQSRVCKTKLVQKPTPAKAHALTLMVNPLGVLGN
jgi:hypothetical protein